MWGLLLVDIARHAARAYARESGYTEDEALTRILDMFEAEVARPTDLGDEGGAGSAPPHMVAMARVEVRVAEREVDEGLLVRVRHRPPPEVVTAAG